jgi:hypothetical protein
MKIVRVTNGAGALTCVRFDASAVGSRSLARLLRRLPGVSGVEARNGWPLTTNSALRFTYRGHPFTVDTPFTDYCLQPEELTCQQGLLGEVAEYLEVAPVTWLMRWV